MRATFRWGTFLGKVLVSPVLFCACDNSFSLALVADIALRLPVFRIERLVLLRKEPIVTRSIGLLFYFLCVCVCVCVCVFFLFVGGNIGVFLLERPKCEAKALEPRCLFRMKGGKSELRNSLLYNHIEVFVALFAVQLYFFGENVD